MVKTYNALRPGYHGKNVSAGKHLTQHAYLASLHLTTYGTERPRRLRLSINAARYCFPCPKIVLVMVAFGLQHVLFSFSDFPIVRAPIVRQPQRVRRQTMIVIQLCDRVVRPGGIADRALQPNDCKASSPLRREPSLMYAPSHFREAPIEAAFFLHGSRPPPARTLSAHRIW